MNTITPTQTLRGTFFHMPAVNMRNRHHLSDVEIPCRLSPQGKISLQVPKTVLVDYDVELRTALNDSRVDAGELYTLFHMVSPRRRGVTLVGTVVVSTLEEISENELAAELWFCNLRHADIRTQLAYAEESSIRRNISLLSLQRKLSSTNGFDAYAHLVEHEGRHFLRPQYHRRGDLWEKGTRIIAETQDV